MTVRRTLAIVTLAAVAALALPGSSSVAARGAARTHKVTAEGSFPAFRWNPAQIEVAVGDKVVWHNATEYEHHVTPYEGPWADRPHLHLEAEGKVAFRFKEPGTYKYYCDIEFHGELLGPLCIGQCGEVVVK